MPSQDTTPVATLSLQGVHPQSHQVQKPKKKTKADLEKELQELCDARAVAEQATAKLVAENASLKAKIAEAASIQDVSATNAITIPRHHAIRGSHKPAVTKAIILHDLQMLGVPASSSKRLYRTVQRLTHDYIKRAGVDMSRTYQEVKYSDKVARVCKMARETKACEVVGKFEDDWFVREMIRQYMHNHRGHIRRHPDGGDEENHSVASEAGGDEEDDVESQVGDED